jgi:hypothetical protein
MKTITLSIYITLLFNRSHQSSITHVAPTTMQESSTLVYAKLHNKLPVSKNKFLIGADERHMVFASIEGIEWTRVMNA